MNLTLIGMAGSGKSYVGALLAKQLGLEFFDIDKVLEEKYEKPLQEILDELGDDLFMQVEAEAVISKTTGRNNLVISPGGSIVYSQRAMKHLQEISKIIYLKASYPVIEQRVGNTPRGIVGLGQRTLRDIYEERDPLYEKYAGVIVSADKEARDMVMGIELVLRRL